MRFGPHISLRALLAGLAAAAATTGAADAACTSNVPRQPRLCAARRFLPRTIQNTQPRSGTGTAVLPRLNGEQLRRRRRRLDHDGRAGHNQRPQRDRGRRSPEPRRRRDDYADQRRECRRLRARRRRSTERQCRDRDAWGGSSGTGGLYADDANSSISATNAVASVAYAGGPAILADQSASISIVGGSVTTTGQFSINARAPIPRAFRFRRITLLPRAAARNAMATNNRTCQNNLTIQSTGGYDPSTGAASGGAGNYASPPYSTTGGVLKLTNSSISATGSESYGVYTANGGVTTLTIDRISLTQQGGFGVQSAVAGQTTITGGTITAAGAGSAGIQATGAGASITTALDNGVGRCHHDAGRGRGGRAGGHGRRADARRRIGDNDGRERRRFVRDRRELSDHVHQRERLDFGRHFRARGPRRQRRRRHDERGRREYERPRLLRGGGCHGRFAHSCRARRSRRPARGAAASRSTARQPRSPGTT